MKYQYEIEIDDTALKEAVLNLVAGRYHAEYSADRRRVDEVVSDAIRKIIYEDKERIIEMIVERASKHCCNKAVAKILEKVNV